MIWRIIAVGKLKDLNLKSCFEDYAGRISRYCRFEHVEIKQGDENAVSARVLEKIRPGEILVVLDEKGLSMTSAEMASKLEKWSVQGVKGINFVIGGAEGVPDTVINRADTKLALSSLTFPHQMARLVLAEQMYRAWTIIRGEPYPR